MENDILYCCIEVLEDGNTGEERLLMRWYGAEKKTEYVNKRTQQIN